MRRAFAAAVAALSSLLVLLSSQTPAVAQKLTLGVIAGTSLTGDVHTGSQTFQGGFSQDGSVTFSYSRVSRPFIVGPKVELDLPGQLSVEVDALYRPLRARQTQTFDPPVVLPNGVTFSTIGPSTRRLASWEFPVLAKYRFRVSGLGPFVEAGPSFRPASSGSGASHLGITAGAGVETRWGKLLASPMVRYTRWKRRGGASGVGSAIADQVEALVAFSHAATNPGWTSAFGRKFSPGVLVGIGLGDDLRLPQGSVERSESNSPIYGALLEFGIGESWAVEVNGIYRALHGRGGPRFAVLTWEFPVLAKYKLRPSQAMRPFVELGPSFRTDGNFNGPRPSHYGITGGAGVEARVGWVKISPMVRYTRWAKERTPDPPQAPSDRSTFLNQVQCLVAFSF